MEEERRETDKVEWADDDSIMTYPHIHEKPKHRQTYIQTLLY